MAAAVRDLCRSDIALLGEGSGHGDGRTMAFKAALVPLLVDRCGFDAILFEGSTYDFLELERRLRSGRPVTRAMVASSVGGLWNRYEEMQPLITWLHQRLVAGRLRIGGIDDQLGSAGAFYSISDMPAELTGLLSGTRAAQCRETFRQRIYGEVGTSPVERAPVMACVADIRGALGTASAGPDRDERLHLLANIERSASRDWVDQAEHMRARDRSMWLNFQWLRKRLPAGSRIIVWGATSHLARSATASGSFGGGDNFGAYIHRERGRRAFFLGFAAASGAYLSGNQVRPRPPAATGSLEAEALGLAKPDSVYLGRAALERLGRRPGGVFSPDPVVTDWAKVIDGLVVFREEQPPRRASPR